MAITIQGKNGSIVAKELINGYNKGIEPGRGPFYTKQYLVPWDASDDFANSLMGLTFGVGGIAGTIIRQAPHQLDESKNLFCLSVGPIEGWGAPIIDGGHPRYAQAIVPAVYGIPTFQLGGSLNNIDPYNLNNFDGEQVFPYCQQSIDYDSESYTADKQWFYAGGPSAGKPIIDSKLTIDVPCATMSITLNRVPFLPKRALFSLLKKCNDAPFLDEPLGTILFDKFRTNLMINTDGTSTQDIDLVFRWRRFPWNTVPDPNDGSQWHVFSADGTLAGRSAYPFADLRGVLFGLNLNVSNTVDYPDFYA